MSVFFQLFYDLIVNLASLWEWLITPSAFVEELTGLSVIPLALILGPLVIIIGIVRALL